jgi:hypothetical protein
MRIFCLLVFLLALLTPLCLGYNFIEVDLVNQTIVFDSFRLGSYNISANLLFDVKKEDNSLVLNVEAKNILLLPITNSYFSVLGPRKIEWLKAKLIKRDSQVFLNYLRSPELLGKGRIDLGSKEMLFDLDCNWRENSILLEGNVKGNLKLWGRLNDFIINGSFDVENGKYHDVDFSRMVLHFLGKPPLFNLNDSEVLLNDGSIYQIEGIMNLRDLTDIFPKAEFVSKKVKMGGWEILSQDQKNAGLKKNIDDNFDVLLATYDKTDDLVNAGTEVRYKLKDDQFLRLRMEDDRTIIGFERRKDF